MSKVIAAAGETSAVPQWRQGPDRFLTFLKDVRTEMRKVVVPSRKEVETTTTVVIITVFLFGAYFFVVDYIFRSVMQTLLAWLAR